MDQSEVFLYLLQAAPEEVLEAWEGDTHLHPYPWEDLEASEVEEPVGVEGQDHTYLLALVASVP